MVIHSVKLTERAKKDLGKVPKYIYRKLMLWILQIELEGLEKVRMIHGYHDEPLRGQRTGQRSIRLNIVYRVIYEIHGDGIIEFVSIEEVNRHDY